jgi:RNA polymerase sigma-70 factor (ECF subfamily)
MTAFESELEKLGTLMQRAQGGDARAYSELLQSVAPRIRQIANSRRGFAGKEQVEDVVQEVLLSLHQVRASYDPARPFLPWLFAIVRNRLADGARRHARTAGREESMDEEDVTFTTQGANSDIGEVVDAARLRDAVRELPHGQRRAIELLKFEGHSLKEAAEITGSSESALKVATHRAIAALRGRLGKK